MPKVSPAVAHEARAKFQVIEGGRVAVRPTIARSVFSQLQMHRRPLSLARQMGVPVADLVAIVFDEAERRIDAAYRDGLAVGRRSNLYPPLRQAA